MLTATRVQRDVAGEDKHLPHRQTELLSAAASPAQTGAEQRSGAVETRVKNERHFIWSPPFAPCNQQRPTSGSVLG